MGAIFFFNHSVFINWLNNHLLPCPFKYITGIDCPMCGFQRSVLALMRGDLHGSFMLYPPAIPIIVFFIYSIADKHFPVNGPKNLVRQTIFVIACCFILISYGIKLWQLMESYKVAARAEI